MARRPLEGSSYWRQEDPNGLLADYDPIKETTGRARAERKGERFVPFEECPRPAVVAPPPVAVVVAPAQASGVSMGLLRRANADTNLSSAGLKILIVVITSEGQASISLSQFGEATGLSKHTVIAGVRSALDGGYLSRSQHCPRCEASLPFTEDQKTNLCPACRKHVPPESRYTVTDTEEAVQNSDSPVQNLHRAVQNSDSPPVQNLDRAVQNSDSLKNRVRTITARMASEAVQNSDSPVQNSDSPVHFLHRAMQNSDSPPVHILHSPVQNLDSLRTHADSDSDSDSNITNDSDSEYMRNGTRNGNGTGKSEVEQLAQASCKALETGTGSLGMHIKAWAHARQLDAKTGGKAHQTALQAIQRELAAHRRETGQVQGKAWTRRVVDYFEGQGVPLMTGRKS